MQKDGASRHCYRRSIGYLRYHVGATTPRWCAMRRTILVAATVVLLVALSGCTKRDIQGTWKQEDGDARVQFLDGEMLDSQYGLPCEYTFDGKTLTYMCPSGDAVATAVRWMGRNTMCAYVMGQWNILVKENQVDSLPKFIDSSIEPSGTVTQYTPKSALDVENISLYSNGVYIFGELSGVWMRNCDNTSLLIYWAAEDTTCADVLVASDKYLCTVPLKSDGRLSVVPKYANKASTVPSGYLLDGVVNSTEGNIVFTFSQDGRCVKTSGNSVSIPYNYTVDADGLVALRDQEALSSDCDYLFLDASTEQVYRVVYESSSWGEYLAGILDEPMNENGDYSVTALPEDLLNNILSTTYTRTSLLDARTVYTLDAEYTSAFAQSLEEQYARILADEAARLEYERSRKTEQERLVEEARIREQEEARVRAEMEARAQAAIESSRYSQ